MLESDVPNKSTYRVSLPNYRWQLKAVRPKPGYPKALNTLADHLKVRRLDLGLTQKDTAVRLAVDPDSVRNWEAGRTSIEVRYYPALIEFLGYNPLPPANTPGEVVRRERMTRGLSRHKLAIAACVDEATVRRVEADTKRTARKCWKCIKTALHLT
jgi:transcriptional regulator with XRE-family HTH domain